MMFLSITAGFVTNSSSVIHYVPNAVLEHPSIVHLFEILGTQNGYLAGNLWNRGACESVAMTREQKVAFKKDLESSEYACAPMEVDIDSEGALIAYDDESISAAYEIARMVEKVSEEMGIPITSWRYN